MSSQRAYYLYKLISVILFVSEPFRKEIIIARERAKVKPWRHTIINVTQPSLLKCLAYCSIVTEIRIMYNTRFLLNTINKNRRFQWCFSYQFTVIKNIQIEQPVRQNWTIHTCVCVYTFYVTSLYKAIVIIHQHFIHKFSHATAAFGSQRNM